MRSLLLILTSLVSLNVAQTVTILLSDSSTLADRQWALRDPLYFLTPMSDPTAIDVSQRDRSHSTMTESLILDLPVYS